KPKSYNPHARSIWPSGYLLHALPITPPATYNLSAESRARQTVSAGEIEDQACAASLATSGLARRTNFCSKGCGDWSIAGTTARESPPSPPTGVFILLKPSVASRRSPSGLAASRCPALQGSATPAGRLTAPPTKPTPIHIAAEY